MNAPDLFTLANAAAGLAWVFLIILDELPRLSHEERRLLCRRALAIDEAADA